MRPTFRIRKSILLLAFMFSVLPTTVDAALIRIVKVNVSYESTTIRHRTPAQYSDVVDAVFDGATNLFTLNFSKAVSGCEVTIYKDDAPVISETYGDVTAGTSYCFDLSVYGSGEYEIVVSTEADEDITCGLTIE